MPADNDVSVSAAPTGRSSCKHCKEPIASGSMRVSMPGRHNGLSVNRYLHPACFARHCLALGYAPTDRAKCALAGTPIGKGPGPGSNQPPPGKRSQTASGQQICFAFNKGNCTRGDKCKFAHESWDPL